MSGIVLSICESGRNDDYGRDFKRRFVQSMNFLAWSAKRAGVLDRLEVVFTDWNSDVPLSHELLLSEDAAKMVRFIEVPSGIARPLNYGKTPFHTCKSLNAAFRRARGKFLSMMPGDILLTQYALAPLFSLLEGRLSVPFDPERSLMGIPRKNIAHYADDKRFFRTPEETEALLLDSDFHLLPDCFCKGLNAGFGMFLLPGESLHVLRGLNEEIGGWGASDVELGLVCAEKQMTLRNLGGLGIVAYDFEVDRKMVGEKKTRNVKPVLRERVNSENWGLAELTLRETRANAGEMTFPSGGEDRADIPGELLFRLRFLPIRACPHISSLALGAGLAAMMGKSRKVLCRRLSEPSPAAMLSLAEPFLSLTFVDDSPDCASRFGEIGGVLAATRHHGHVHFQSSDPPDLSGFDLIVSGERMPGRQGLEMPERKLFLYGDLPEKLREADLRPLNGNVFTGIHFVEKRVKLWYIIGRLGLVRWIPVLRQLWKKYGR